MRTADLIIALPVTLLAACGSLTDERQTPSPLATVHGTLASIPAGSAQRPVSLAILWATAPTFAPSWDSGPWPGAVVAPTDGACDPPAQHLAHQIAGGHFLSEPVTYQPQFPLSFELPITGIPPAEAQVDLAEWGGAGHIAVGFVIAYYDDGNGTFDLPTASSSPDTLVAVMNTTGLVGEEQPVLVYLDGQLPASISAAGRPDLLRDLVQHHATLPAGFSLAVLTFDADPSTPASITGLPATTPITLRPAVGEPYELGGLDDYLCATLDVDDVVGGPLLYTTPYETSEVCSSNGVAYFPWFDARREGPCSWTFARSVHCTGQPVAPGTEDCTTYLPSHGY